MRRFDKIKHIEAANKRLEESFLIQKGYINENLLTEADEILDFFNFIENDPRLNTIATVNYTSTLDVYLAKSKTNPMLGKFLKFTKYEFRFGQTYDRAVELKNPEWIIQQRKGEFEKVQGYKVLEFDKSGNLVLPIIPTKVISSVIKVLDENGNIKEEISMAQIKEKYGEFFRPSFFEPKANSGSGIDFRLLKVDNISKIAAGGKVWINPHFKYKEYLTSSSI